MSFCWIDIELALLINFSLLIVMEVDALSNNRHNPMFINYDLVKACILGGGCFLCESLAPSTKFSRKELYISRWNTMCLSWSDVTRLIRLLEQVYWVGEKANRRLNSIQASFNVTIDGTNEYLVIVWWRLTGGGALLDICIYCFLSAVVLW